MRAARSSRRGYRDRLGFHPLVLQGRGAEVAAQ